MASDGLQRTRRSDAKAQLPTELERALRNCGAALQSLGAAEARVSRQLAAVRADRALLAQKPFTRLSAAPGVLRDTHPSTWCERRSERA